MILKIYFLMCEKLVLKQRSRLFKTLFKERQLNIQFTNRCSGPAFIVEFSNFILFNCGNIRLTFTLCGTNNNILRWLTII